jgi:hypothetical protein
MFIDRDDYQFELNDDGTATVIKYRGGNVMPVVPEEVEGFVITSVGDWAFGRFLGKRPLLDITLPDTLTSIGDYAFANCTKLTVLDIPKGVTTIGAAAFSGCASLLRLKLPQGLTVISDWLFKDCHSLTGVSIPYSVRELGKGVFAGCKALAEVFLPDDISAIEFEAFRGCKALSYLTLPPGLTRIGDGAFKGCQSLAHLTIPPRVTYIGGTDTFPTSTILHAQPASYTESYAKMKRLAFTPLDEQPQPVSLPEYKYEYEPKGKESVSVSKSMLDVLKAILGYGGDGVVNDSRLFGSLLNDLLPGTRNAGVRNVLNAAAAQLSRYAPSKDDPAAQERFAQTLCDLGYQQKLAREAASCFWTVLCYSDKPISEDDEATAPELLDDGFLTDAGI